MAAALERLAANLLHETDQRQARAEAETARGAGEGDTHPALHLDRRPSHAASFTTRLARQHHTESRAPRVPIVMFPWRLAPPMRPFMPQSALFTHWFEGRTQD